MILRQCCQCALAYLPSSSRSMIHLSRYRPPLVLRTTQHVVIATTSRFKSDSSNGAGDNPLSSLFEPIAVKPCNDPDGINVGEELTGALEKEEMKRVLNRFYRDPTIVRLAAENGLDKKLYHQTFVNFRRFCAESDALPVDLHVVLSDILSGAGHVTDILPYFMRHARRIFPHLECIDDLRHISDLRLPANWYPEARALQRKFVFHAGPTNSGKTYHALKRLMEAKSGVYCGPLRMLANEVFNRANAAGTPCDLVTGEDRRYASCEDEPSAHVACTVEMTSVTTKYEVAVIDEIQMLRDISRGWAWTRALFGVCAEEVHVCGEPAAIELVRELVESIGEEVEIRNYKRLTPLTVLNKAVVNFDHVRPGDCIVCFSKNDIYHCSRQLERRNIQNAVIYGSLPPGTKLAQSEKFNNPMDPCKVMVATDAIGMGLNLSIKRMIFYSLVKPYINDKGEKEIDVIPVHMAKQIAGRAGRYGTIHSHGKVTTFRPADISLLKTLLAAPIDTVQKAGLHPTAEQIELFAYHLPNATLSNLIDIFVSLCQVDSDSYFMCHMDDFKFLADMVEHIPLQLRARYVFCCAPIPKRIPFVCTMFLKYARKYSQGEAISLDWLYRQVGWPVKVPNVMSDLVHLEGVFDVQDLYLWLGYRFPDMFPNMDEVRDMQTELDLIIQAGVVNMTRLLRNTETDVSMGTSDTDDMPDRVITGYQNEDDDDNEENKPKKKKVPTVRQHYESVRGERLSESLLRQGILTKSMLRKLKREMATQKQDTNNEDR